jgi:hypothetical protein
MEYLKPLIEGGRCLSIGALGRACRGNENVWITCVTQCSRYHPNGKNTVLKEDKIVFVRPRGFYIEKFKNELEGKAEEE